MVGNMVLPYEYEAEGENLCCWIGEWYQPKQKAIELYRNFQQSNHEVRTRRQLAMAPQRPKA